MIIEIRTDEGKVLRWEQFEGLTYGTDSYVTRLMDSMINMFVRLDCTARDLQEQARKLHSKSRVLHPYTMDPPSSPGEKK